MIKRKLCCFAVLLSLTLLLLSGCYGWANYSGLVEQSDLSGLSDLPDLSDFEDLSLELEPGGEYPLFLDERLHYGMTDAEVIAVLGEPDGAEEDIDFVTMTTLYYPWSFDEYEAELDLGFLNIQGELTLCSVNLFVYCDEGEEEQIVTRLKSLVNEAYGNLPGISIDIMTEPGRVWFICTA